MFQRCVETTLDFRDSNMGVGLGKRYRSHVLGSPKEIPLKGICVGCCPKKVRILGQPLCSVKFARGKTNLLSVRLTNQLHKKQEFWGGRTYHAEEPCLRLDFVI